MYHNTIVSLLLLLVVLAPFLGVLYSVLDAWLQSGSGPEIAEH